jgi:hypothetical protein
MSPEFMAELEARNAERLPMTLDADQVRALYAELTPPPEVGQEVESSELKGPLPEGFPGLVALNEAGIHTYHQVRKQRDGEGLTAVEGIGDATAEKIEEALKG